MKRRSKTEKHFVRGIKHFIRGVKYFNRKVKNLTLAVKRLTCFFKRLTPRHKQESSIINRAATAVVVRPANDKLSHMPGKLIPYFA